MNKYFIVFLISMVPLIELRGAIPYAVGFELPLVPSYIVAVIGNMLPVPVIYLFARKVLVWGSDKKVLGKPFSWILEKGEKAGKKLEAKAENKKDIVLKYEFWGLVLLVAIPLPGTGAWTGALVAAMMDMRLKRAMPAICLGVVIAGIIVTSVTYGAGALF